MSKQVHSAKLIWRDLRVGPKELHLDTLKCGQSFRWRNVNDLWSCVLNGKLYTLKQTPSTVLYGILPEEEEKTANMMESTLRDYFQLDRVESLEAHYQRWGQLDVNFKNKSIHFNGIRILRQDPWENLVSFICSSNNNIARISQMVGKLCTHYGPYIATLDGVDLYDFPSVDALAAKKSIEEQLRQLGFGYRAKYIAQTVQQIRYDYPPGWLANLRNVSYPEAKQALVSLAGVGPKVADCVCLMSLDHPEAIPVDTHVWQIALRDYGFGNNKSKTLTSKLYDQVGDHFRSLFGEYSGWAHSVLFTADLRSFEDRLQVVEKEEEKIKVEEIHSQQDDNVKEEKKVTIVKQEEVVKKRASNSSSTGNTRKRARKQVQALEEEAEGKTTVRRSARIKKTS